MSIYQNGRLYMDVANYLTSFFPLKKNCDLNRANQVVRRFVEASRYSGWDLVIFIDATTQTEETKIKWRERREREVREGRRNVPQGALHLIGDMFKDNGVPVHYSFEADNDDTLAFHAHADDASVLSGDADFFRYEGASYLHGKIYSKFEIRDDILHLFPSERSRQGRPIIALRDPPATSSDSGGFRDVEEKHYYLRGTPSPLIGLGNVHTRLRPLRQAMYHAKGWSEIIEEFPERGPDGEPVWRSETVRSDNTFAALLRNPSAAVRRFAAATRPEGASWNDWEKHKFAERAVVAEICQQVIGGSLFDILLSILTADAAARSEKAAQKKQKMRARREPPWTRGAVVA
jgi:hypothetical protein